MYFVEGRTTEQSLDYIDGLLEEVNEGAFTSRLQTLGLDRIVHMLAEAILDVGNMMIDGFIMRDPGSYTDIIDILVDERVLPPNEEASYKDVIELRQMIVKHYLTIDHNEVKQRLMKQKPTLASFSHHIHSYLNNELGVANTFVNEYLLILISMIKKGDSNDQTNTDKAKVIEYLKKRSRANH